MRRWLLGIDGTVREFEDLPDPISDKQLREHLLLEEYEDFL